jgi:methionine-rich copper-binding protein CopC
MKGTDQDIERGRNGRSDATKGMARATFLVHVRSPWHDLYSAYHVQYHAVCTDTHVPTHTSILFFMWEVLVPLPLCLSPCSPFVQRFYVRFRPTIKWALTDCCIQHVCLLLWGVEGQQGVVCVSCVRARVRGWGSARWCCLKHGVLIGQLVAPSHFGLTFREHVRHSWFMKKLQSEQRNTHNYTPIRMCTCTRYFVHVFKHTQLMVNEKDAERTEKHTSAHP